ncbi:DUF3040 domain-containing protein [Arthrobacter sp. Soc17.1.1.1]|uniref:DUF3040 domain-containing protein n=1 Tax=Arthrobacter sp. Soc17.1.1.1 TaxID=3121277 RepID=UPI002FE4A549
MTLSRQERQAWNELERILADELPYTPASAVAMTAGPTSTGILPPALSRALILITILAVGAWLLILGALAQLLPMALTGLIVVCVAADRLQRPAPQQGNGIPQR